MQDYKKCSIHVGIGFLTDESFPEYHSSQSYFHMDVRVWFPQLVFSLQATLTVRLTAPLGRIYNFSNSRIRSDQS